MLPEGLPHRSEAELRKDCAQRWTVLMVEDPDEASAGATGRWHSIMKRGSLCKRAASGVVVPLSEAEATGATEGQPSPAGQAGPGPEHEHEWTVSWLDEIVLSSSINDGGRGMELSTLTWHRGRLLTCDDRTGVMYEVIHGALLPRYILSDGDGEVRNGDGNDAGRGFKCEWAAVRHGKLYVGSVGKEWIAPSGALLHRRAQWVKLVDGDAVRHVNWTDTYEALRHAAGCPYPGYLWHEAALWDDSKERWLFMPRRASETEPYDEVLDETRGASLLLWASGTTQAALPGKFGRRAARRGAAGDGARAPQITVGHVRGERDPRRGFSAIKLLPGEPGTIVAVRTQELRGKVSSYLTVLREDGTVLMRDTLISNASKFEGLEVASSHHTRANSFASPHQDQP